MKSLAILAFAFLCSSSLFATDEKHAADPKAQEMMKAWQEYSTPGEAHKVLAGMAGNWTYTSKMWHKPDSPPEESKGTTQLKMILGGRFLENKTKGQTMGESFEGLGYTGYNNIDKKYETVWMDSMATGLMHGTGSFDKDTKVLKDSGEFSCPMKKGKPEKYRSEWKIIDKNNMTYTMWMPDEAGKEFKSMELMLKRAK